MNFENLPEQGPGTPGGRSTRALSITKLIDIQGFRAIDLGAHGGHNTFDLYECGCREVLGVEARDSYLAMANDAKRQLGYDAVRFMQADVRQIDQRDLGKFDLCLCSGLLYHLQNPFNVLKRIRNVCRYLALETHIIPSFFHLWKCKPKYRKNLTWRTYSVILDGVAFTGRLNIFPPSQDMQKTSGSIASHATFWLEKSSLLNALELAGFHIRAVYFGTTPPGCPEILIDHGVARTKIFIFAEVKEPERVIPVEASRIIGCERLLKS